MLCRFAVIPYSGPQHVSSYVTLLIYPQPTVFLGTLPDLPGYDIPYKPRFMITTSISLLLQLCSSYIILAAVIYNQFCFYRYDLRLSVEFRQLVIYTMLSTPTATPSAVILDLQRHNWSQWIKSLKLLCYTKFGVAGQLILSDRLIPLQPFALAPTKSDLDKNALGRPIPN